jgi:hypothetical protein
MLNTVVEPPGATAVRHGSDHTIFTTFPANSNQRNGMIQTMRAPRTRLLAAMAALALTLAACGSSSPSSGSHSAAAPRSASASTPARPSASGSTPSAALAAAESPRAGQFPAVNGRTLEQLSAGVRSSLQFGAAGSVFTTGADRVDFALNTASGALVYAPTVLYLASSPSSHDVTGPIVAPADPMTVPVQYRSKQYEGPGDLLAIYTALLRFPHAGTFDVLALTRTATGLVGAPGQISVAASTRIPAVGQRAPSIATDTLASLHGNLSLLTTRQPPEHMASASVALDQVLGRKPVALLFSTPQLCTSRVCGPVTDELVSLQASFPGVVFIHQEVYADNDPAKGLRTQMKEFHLQTEPWLFTINRSGIITARLEGAFGLNEARAAIRAALQ